LGVGGLGVGVGVFAEVVQGVHQIGAGDRVAGPRGAIQ